MTRKVFLPGATSTDPAAVAVDNTGGSVTLCLRALPLLRRRVRDWAGSFRAIDHRPLMTEGPNVLSDEAARRQQAVAKQFGRELRAAEETVERTRSALWQARDAARACSAMLLEGVPAPKHLRDDPWVVSCKTILAESDVARASGARTDAIRDRLTELGKTFSDTADEISTAIREDAQKWDPVDRLISRASARLCAITRWGQIAARGTYAELLKPGTDVAKARYRKAVNEDIARHFQLATAAKREAAE